MAAPQSGRALFTRQSSGLVREVSVVNALFFNTAAFIGVGLGWYPVFYSLAGISVGTYAGFTTYGWAALIVGAFSVLLALIFASLTSVMPRSGGDYVFTSRIVPRVGPFLGWMESWTLAFSSLAIIAFEVPIVVQNLQITGRIIGLGTGSSFFGGANSWFTDDTGLITGVPGFIAALIVLALVAVIVFQPTRRFHRIVTTLALLSLAAGVLMFVLGLTAIDPATFAANLPGVAGGVTVDQLAAAADKANLIDHGAGLNLDPAVFSFMAGILLFQYIGFQYSAYIAGEVRGNVRRSILIAMLGALAIAVFMNSVYTDFIAARLGINGQVGWGAAWWGFVTQPALPLGQPNSMPLMGVIANPGLWPIWALISLAVTVFPFLLCPVYIVFLSRVQLAWSLDRQVPEWFGTVSERLRAPANAILAALVVAVLFAAFQNFPLLNYIPGASGLSPTGKLNLVATAWFGILAGGLTWIMPGVNAVLVRFTRPDLVRDAPYAFALPFLGIVWLVFAVVLYWYAGILPIWNNITGQGSDALAYLNKQGVTFVVIVVVVGVAIYVVQSLRNRAHGIDTRLMYRELPPD
ncbi:MAG: APC family permease [Chloroflexi bacterium]|nr:APC family permease [Chloroflexota bacterium]